MATKKTLIQVEGIILAAGLGTRMKSNLPKVVHTVCEVPMIELLLRQITKTSFLQSVNIVIGHGREKVRSDVDAFFAGSDTTSKQTYSVQEEQLGTAHAVKIALENSKASAPTVAIFNGDLPLFTTEAFQEFVEAHVSAKSAASLASATLPDAGTYGRILRKGKSFTGVVEHKDATLPQRKIKEFNGGVYLFDRALLSDALKNISNKNASKEFYLPDVFAYALKKKKKIYAHCFADAELLRGVNTMGERAEAQRILYARVAERHMKEGVFIHDPQTTWIGPDVRLSRGVDIAPFTRIQGQCQIAEGAKIGSHCELKNVSVGVNTTIRNGTFAESAKIGANCAIGPMAHLRPGTELAGNVKVGNFVEIKESKIGSHTNAAHLSYIGDATIGEHVNLGCGFITCNFDGRVIEGKRKHPTKIGNNVFIGSDSQVVAPIVIADGTFIASGSTVTDSVKEPHSLVIARTRQTTKPGYARKYKK